MMFASNAVLVAALVVVLPLAGCETSAAPSPAGSEQLTVPGVPTFACASPLGSLTIDLPCQVGYPLGASSTISAVECTVHSPTNSGKVSFLIPLGEISQHLNSATDLAGFPAAPLYGVNAMTLERLGGNVVFSAVDVSGRAFVGRFVDASLTFSPPNTVCGIHDGLLRAVPGEFL
jgi:hypothetical protein